ncbi:hypothetical protein GCM10025875_37790 [Litorihabitans aurantiacus]|uniref:Type IV secretion system protein n=1 Tax=Litorihabitans aurantiacus TaxID=1930061 RepID=A0AA37XIK5_9MICO|nr:hypothetical protein GCM10025875_37790 [Litorihabitans aurantiacus]
MDLGQAPGAAELTQVLSYITWIGFAVATLALILLGVMVARGVSRGQGAGILNRSFWFAAGVVVLGGGAAIVGAVMPTRPQNVAGTAAFLQSSLWYFTGALVVLSVIIGGIRMVITQRADAGKDVLRSLVTFLVVSALGVTITALLITVSDRFSVWILEQALDCPAGEDAACFGENLVRVLHMAEQGAGAGGDGSGAGPTLVPLMIIVLGLIALLAALVQVVLMFARAGMLVLMTGLLPTVASFTSTETGRAWFWKAIGWTGAFIAYKPVAAIIYATGFQLVGSDWATSDPLQSTLTGLLMLGLAVVALPAMMRFVTPVVGAAAGGAGGGALAAGALAALPTGAAAIARLGGGGGGSGSGGGAAVSTQASPQGSNGSAGQGGSQGAPGPAGSTSQGAGAPAPGGTSSPGGAGGSQNGEQGASGSGGSKGGSGGGSAGQSGSPGGRDGASGASQGGGGAGAAGGSGPGAGAAGGGASGAAAGAASKAHPVVAAASVAADGAKAAGAAAKQVGKDVSGEGGGPSGSR